MARGRKGSVRARPGRATGGIGARSSRKRTARTRSAQTRSAQVSKPARKAGSLKRNAKPAASKRKAQVASRPKPQTRAKPAAAGLDAIVNDLTAERDRLKAELQAALKRLQRLENTQREVTERIDKAISSIHNVLDTRN